MTIEALRYEHHGDTLNGFIGLPDKGQGPWPGVMVVHAADGITEGVVARVGMLNDLGYAAFAPDLYGGVHPLRGPAMGEAMMTLRGRPGVLRARLRAALDLMAAHPEVDADRMAAIGYCFGGLSVLELARDGAPVRGVVSYHGLLTTEQPAQPGAIRARVLVCTGARDPYAPFEDVASFQREMIAAEADWQVITYGRAEHAFAIIGPMPDVDMPGISYDASSDRQSWAATLTFFDEIF
jgi:dienelactone hydrolase